MLACVVYLAEITVNHVISCRRFFTQFLYTVKTKKMEVPALSRGLNVSSDAGEATGNRVYDPNGLGTRAAPIGGGTLVEGGRTKKRTFARRQMPRRKAKTPLGDVSSAQDVYSVTTVDSDADTASDDVDADRAEHLYTCLIDADRAECQRKCEELRAAGKPVTNSDMYGWQHRLSARRQGTEREREVKAQEGQSQRQEAPASKAKPKPKAKNAKATTKQSTPKAQTAVSELESWVRPSVVMREWTPGDKRIYMRIKTAESRQRAREREGERAEKKGKLKKRKKLTKTEETDKEEKTEEKETNEEEVVKKQKTSTSSKRQPVTPEIARGNIDELANVAEQIERKSSQELADPATSLGDPLPGLASSLMAAVRRYGPGMPLKEDPETSFKVLSDSVSSPCRGIIAELSAIFWPVPGSPNTIHKLYTLASRGKKKRRRCKPVDVNDAGGNQRVIIRLTGHHHTMLQQSPAPSATCVLDIETLPGMCKICVLHVKSFDILPLYLCKIFTYCVCV